MADPVYGGRLVHELFRGRGETEADRERAQAGAQLVAEALAETIRRK